MPAPMTTTEKGGPPLLVASCQVLQRKRPSASTEKVVSWTWTCWAAGTSFGSAMWVLLRTDPTDWRLAGACSLGSNRIRSAGMVGNHRQGDLRGLAVLQ